MGTQAPGRNDRKGMSFLALIDNFPDNETAERWLITTRWPNGPGCIDCQSSNVYERKRKNGQLVQFRCRACRKLFSVKAGTLMQDSKLPLRTWVIALYLLSTNLKGASSMKIHRDLDITQKSAWHLAHRIRETWQGNYPTFPGPVEADETYIGGKNRNRHKNKRIKGSGPTLRHFVKLRTKQNAMVYTDEHASYRGLRNHAMVRHSAGEYVRDQAHTNGIESFWSMLKRGYYGTYHKMSTEHLDRYVGEFAGRHNQRSANTIDQMAAMMRGMEGKRLQYQELVA